jgi:hypothetical protein
MADNLRLDMKSELGGGGGGAGDAAGGWFAMIQNLSMDNQHNHFSDSHHSDSDHGHLSDTSSTPRTPSSTHDFSTSTQSTSTHSLTSEGQDLETEGHYFDNDSHRLALDARLDALAQNALVPEEFSQDQMFDHRDSDSTLDSEEITSLGSIVEELDLSSEDKSSEDARAKLAILEKEFGKLPNLIVPEVYTSESQAALVSNVLVGVSDFMPHDFSKLTLSDRDELFLLMLDLPTGL